MDQTAEVLTKFTGDTKDLDKKTASADKTIKGVAKGLEKAFKIATVAVGATATAIGALVKKSVDAYADFEQLEGGLVSLFGEGSAEMQNILAKSEEAYKNLTMSQNDYLTAFQSAYPLVNAGLSENADSVEYTNKMLQISSDLFNTYGGSVEYYQNAINWALKGSFVYLDNLNLGIKGTQKGFIEAANASGVLGRQIESVNELTSDEIIDVIAHYADAYGVLGRTADEAGGTILGSINMMKASWSNFIAGLSKDGADLDGLIKNVVDSAVNVGNNLLPVITRALESIVKALPTIVENISKTLPGTLKTIIPVLIQSAIDILNAVVAALPEFIPVLMDGVIQLVNAIVQNAPTILQSLINMLPAIALGFAQALPTLIPTIVEGIIQLMDIFNQNMPLFLKCGLQIIIGIVQGLLNSIPLILQNLPTIIEFIINFFTIEKLFSAGKMLITSLGQGLAKSIPELIKNIPKLIGKIINAFKNGMSLKEIGVNLIKGLWSGIGSVKDWILSKIGGFTKSVLKSIRGFFGIKSPSKVMAKEVGQWIPKGIAVGIDTNVSAVNKSMKDIQKDIAATFSISPQVTGSSALHYSPQFNPTIYNNINQDPLGRMVNDIKTFSGGAKNDYNYGMGGY